MGKRLPDFHLWQWRGCAASHCLPAHLVLKVIALPLLILAALLIIDGVISFSAPSLAIGIIGLIAALGIQRHGQR